MYVYFYFSVSTGSFLSR